MVSARGAAEVQSGPTPRGWDVARMVNTRLNKSHAAAPLRGRRAGKESLMGRKSQDREIGGATWTVTQFPATEGLAILTRLLKLAGPALGAVARGEGAKPLEVGTFVSGLVDQLDEVETVTLVKRLLRETRKDGREVLPVFDVEFMGNYFTLLTVLGFVLEVNYGDFFGALGQGSSAEVSPAV